MRSISWLVSAPLPLCLIWSTAAVAQVAPAPTPEAQPATPAADPASDSATPAAAGDTAAVPGSDIVVTGTRASLRSAQSIKQNSSQIVDSIVADDIGKLPDRNVAEALQRVAGIQIQRNYGEGSSVAIRGLTQVRTELNGRDIFTAGGVDQLSLEDVPAE
ncbi:MAG: TonB-dependent receptor, partial [Sphingomonas sp.]